MSLHTEFEIKFTGIEPDEMRKKLQTIGANCTIPLRRMQRFVFAHPTNPHAYIRIRQEGHKTTTSYKHQLEHDGIDNVQEIEVTIDNAEAMRAIYKACGLTEKAIQETYRENRAYNDIDITIDRWPGLRPFIEIEGPSIESVQETISLLGLQQEDGILGTVSNIYNQELGIPLDIINTLPVISFDNPPTRYMIH